MTDPGFRRDLRYLALAATIVTALAGCNTDHPTAPKPAALRITTPPSASAQTLVPLQVQPTVQIVDAGGRAVPRDGLVITASVSAGDGVVVAGATAITNAEGVAQFQNLALGASAGEAGDVTLRFSAPGLNEVTAAIQLSCAVKPMTLAVEVHDELQTGDCIRTSGVSRGSLMKLYDLHVPAEVKALRITNRASSFAPAVLVRGPDEANRFIGWHGGCCEFDISFKMLVPGGVHRIMANSFEPGRTGSFRLRISAAAEDEDTCQWVRNGALVFLQPILLQTPVNTTQTLRAECAGPDGTVVALFAFVLSRGGSINASVTSTAFRPHIEIRRADSAVREVSHTATENTAVVTFTSSELETTAYYVLVSSATGTETGSYSFQATMANPATGSMR